MELQIESRTGCKSQCQVDSWCRTRGKPLPAYCRTRYRTLHLPDLHAGIQGISLFSTMQLLVLRGQNDFRRKTAKKIQSPEG